MTCTLRKPDLPIIKGPQRSVNDRLRSSFFLPQSKKIAQLLLVSILRFKSQLKLVLFGPRSPDNVPKGTHLVGLRVKVNVRPTPGIEKV